MRSAKFRIHTACLIIALVAFVVSALAAEFGVSTSSYLGDSGNADAVRGARILSDGKIVLAANLGTAAPGGTVTLLNGATAATPGAIVRLSPDGKTVLSVTRLAAEVRDLAVDASDNLYVAAANDGVIKLNATATAIVWQGAVGNYIHRVDAGPSGRCVAISTTTPSNADEAAGAGTVWSFDAAGALVASWAGKNNTMDVCIDEASATVIYLGFRQANAYGPPGDTNGILPVQISYLKGVDYAGANKWLAYDWAANTGYDSATDSYIPGANDSIPAGTAQSKIEPRFINRLDNNMADTRGLRCALGADGQLYAGFECAGGNHIFRDGTFDLAASGSIVGGDYFHQFINTGAAHKTYIGRHNPATGAVLLGQQFATTISGSGGAPSSNTQRLKAGDLAADANGRLYFGSQSAYGLAMLPNKYFTPAAGQQTFNPFTAQDYLGGAYFMVMSADFSQRLYVTRLATSGVTHAVAARVLAGETEARIAFAGEATLNGGPVYTLSAVQPQPGYGTQDGFFAVLGGAVGGSNGAGYKFTYGGPGVSYASGSPLLRGVASTNVSPLDLDGDGYDDSERGYAFSTTTPLSPTSGYTGPQFFGGFRARTLNAWTQTFNDSHVSGNEVKIRIQPAASAPCAEHGVIYFDKTAFAGVGVSDKLSFSRVSSLYANTGGMGRWLVRQRGIFYVSEATIADSSSLFFENDTDDGRWAIYDPATDLDFNATAANFETRNFDDIDGVGFVLDFDTYGGFFWLKFSHFIADFALNHADDGTPAASFTLTPATGAFTFTPTLDASASADPGGAVTFFAWDFDDGSGGSGPVTTHSYAAAGAYLPTLTVYDAGLQRAQATRRVSVTSTLGGAPANTVAAFGGSVGSTAFRAKTTTSGVDLDGDGPDDFIVQIPFDTTQPLSGSAQKGTKFFGGLHTTERNAASNWSDAGTVGSALGWRVQPVTNAAVTTHGVLFVDKGEFLNRAHLRPVTFDATSTVKLAGITHMDALGQVRWLVRDGAQFYVSQATITPVSGSATLTFASASNHGNWAAWTVPADMNFDAAGAVFTQRTFTNVTAVGIVMDSDTASTSRHWLEFSGFEVVGVISQNNAAPVAAISASPLNRDVLQPVTFDGSASTSSGVLENYAWDFGDGSGASGAVATHQFLTTGAKTVTLTVTDDLGQSDSETFIYTVTANAAPVASFTATPTSGEVPLTVNFNAGGSTDNAGIVSYEWDFNGDGTWDAAGVTAAGIYSAPFLYPARLRVTDAGGKTSVTTVNIRATSGGKIPPVALFTESSTGGAAPLNVTLTALQSWDSDGTIASYAWDFNGDGVTDATGVTTSWNFVTAGTHVIRLTITDNDGATSSTTQTVTVTTTAGAIPIAYWAGESVTANKSFRGVNPTNVTLDLDGDGSADDQRSHYPFSSTTPLSPPTGYTGTPFFGGIRNDVLNTSSYTPSDSGVLNNSAADYISQRMQPATGLAARWHWVLFFDKANFLNGGAQNPVHLAANSRLRLAGSTHFEKAGTMRWLVRDGAQFYVSQATATVTSGTASLTFASDADDGMWATFDPAADLNFDDATAVFAPRNFTNLTAAGFILDQDTYEAARHWFDFATFEFLAALPPSFGEWIATFPAIPAADRDPLDDPDFDGLANLLEYALGLDPSVPNRPPAALTLTDGTGAHLAITFTRPNDRIGITLTGEVTAPLGNPWLSGAADVGQTITPNGDGTETVTVWDKTPLGAAAQRFLRLRVTQP